MKREVLVEKLEEASEGNYQIIIDLVKVLENGRQYKEAVDWAIDNTEFLLNIRNQILISRVNYAVTKNPNSLGYALDCLERYFSLIVFQHYIDVRDKAGVSFNTWLHVQRPEIWNMYSSIRKRRSEKLKIFRPIDDLSTITDNQIAVQKMGTSEGESIVLKNRSGIVLSSNTILKSDHWQQPQIEEAGAPNFRQIEKLPVFAVAQPTIEGIKQVLERATINDTLILWINLREEPLVYINGEPYVLRDHFATLRNIKVFSGISKERLEGMEETLKDEIIKESNLYEGRILVHEEVSGQLVATWECIKQVTSPKEKFSSFSGLKYCRIPITAEDAPDVGDFDLFKTILLDGDTKKTVILNCQMGIGRSTIGTIISLLILNLPLTNGPHNNSFYFMELINFEVINSLVRMLPDGIWSKEHLDQVIDMCSQKFNLANNILTNDKELMGCLDPIQISKSTRKLVFSLKRYFLLLCFTQYLKQGIKTTFKEWFERHEEIKTLFEELEKGKLIEKISNSSSSRTTPLEGNDLWKVLKNRRGSVLAPLTILKFDHFPGCHRMSLPQKIEGAPNFRGLAISTKNKGKGINIYGVAMPTALAIENIIQLCTQQHYESSKETVKRRLTWICLREEPVIYVNGRPFVLRIVRDPNDNISMTGIETERVELLEQRLLEEVQKEADDNNGLILLHEEGAEQPIIPIREPLISLKTMSQVFADLDVSYYRLPITDEQSPIPRIFDAISTLVEAGEDIIFNCQMGRGRTTTGMIITTIMTLISTGSLEPKNGNGNYGEDEAKKYLAGEYRIITHLTQILPNGKKSKQMADESINLCSELQNLREAIYAYKLKLQTQLGLEEEEKRTLNEQGTNYLSRYFYLICFSEYYYSDNKGGGFEAWLNERREIGNLIRRIDFS